jgi:hypothetical protein
VFLVLRRKRNNAFTTKALQVNEYKKQRQNASRGYNSEAAGNFLEAEMLSSYI